MPIDVSKLDLRDALDLAIAMEQEAKDRYEWFTTQVGGGRYPGDAADVFHQMAVNEAKHGAELKARRDKLFGGQPARVNTAMIDDLEAPDHGKPRVFMSARQAMEVALESEVKAQEFYDGAARITKDPDVRKLFEELRAEEVQHQAWLREWLKHQPKGPDVEEAEADAPGSDPG
jgi:rubrerythrin